MDDFSRAAANGRTMAAQQNAPGTIIVVGHDHLALLVCEELRDARGVHVVLLWENLPGLAERAAGAGIEYVARKPDAPSALEAAGIGTAKTIVALSEDDRLNLLVALRARDHNPGIRIVLRQFNRTLGRKIESNLKNSAVLSLAAYSAATFASAAVDPEIFQAVQFPYLGGPLLGFARVPASELPHTHRTVARAEEQLRGRILASGPQNVIDRDAELKDDHEVILFRSVVPVVPPPPSEEPAIEREAAAPKVSIVTRVRRRLDRMDTVLKWFLGLTLAVFATATVYFTLSAHLRPLNAAFLVTEIISTNGPTDIAFKDQGPASLFFAMFLMIAGVGLTGFFVALLTSQLTKLQWVTLQGLRPIHRSGHIVICGAGAVGSRVIDYLLALGQKLVVIEMNPKAGIIEASREKHFDLLTGDATLDSTLELCNIGRARALIALTENDTMNLEVALSARARNANLQVVMRVVDDAFETSVRNHFDFDTTFAPATLAAPAFAGLVFTDGARGHVEFAGAKYGICETTLGDPAHPTPGDDAIPLCTWRAGAIVFIHDLADARPGELVLYLVPLAARRSPSHVGLEALAGSGSATR